MQVARSCIKQRYQSERLPFVVMKNRHALVHQGAAFLSFPFRAAMPFAELDSWEKSYI